MKPHAQTESYDLRLAVVIVIFVFGCIFFDQQGFEDDSLNSLPIETTPEMIYKQAPEFQEMVTPFDKLDLNESIKEDISIDWIERGNESTDFDSRRLIVQANFVNKAPIND